MIDSIINNLLSSGVAYDASGKEYEIHSNISYEEGDFIRSLIRENDFNNTIEIGCAFGLSSLYICDGLSGKVNPHHIIIDPYESTYWHNIGVHNLNSAGVSYYELLEEKSETALPALVKEERKVDFAFIDGNHNFENAFIDFFFIDQLLKNHGIVAFHDYVHFHSVRSAIHKLIYLYPNYNVVGFVATANATYSHQALSFVKHIAGLIVRQFPERYTREFFNEYLFMKPLKVTKSNLILIALQKTPDH